MATGAEEEKVGVGGDDVAHGVIELSKEQGAGTATKGQEVTAADSVAR
jgi:hypothetical protein